MINVLLEKDFDQITGINRIENKFFKLK